MDFTGLINGLTSAFKIFVGLLRVRPLITILALNLIALFGIIGMIAYIALSDPSRALTLGEAFMDGYRNGSQIVEPFAVPIPPEEEAKRLQESIPRDALTCAAVNEVGEQLQADRVTFWTFSNGSYGLGGVPFNYANVHCPYVAEGTAFIPDDFQKIPNSISAETNSVLFPNYRVTECGYWTRDKIQSPYLRASMKALGTVAMVQCGVRDGSANLVPIGKIIVAWRTLDPNRDIEAIMKTLRATADAIGLYNTPTVPIEALPRS